YSAYPLAKQQFELEENKEFNLTQVIGLTNEDPVSEEQESGFAPLNDPRGF
ncbi:hypothetical protein H6A19_15265, partial [Clostridium saudiense]|nr:hypothetical protein [Clostridium saudiense]